MKSIVISSIGTARPNVSKIIADIIGVSTEVVVKLLYCAPTVLFQNIEESFATNTYNLLSQLGLEVKIQDSSDPLPSLSELFDIAVYIPEPTKMFLVKKQLAEFIGCSENEAFGLLLKEPSIVLGSVSLATAQALSKRIDSEVIASNPKTDLYTLNLIGQEAIILKQVEESLLKYGKPFVQNQRSIEDLDYETAKELWKKYGTSKQIELVNQSFQRFEIILDHFDAKNQTQVAALTDIVKMPLEIIEEIANNLPVMLNDSVNKATLSELLAVYRQAGLQCSYKAIATGNYHIHIQSITDIDKTKDILKQFFEPTEIPKSKEKWQSPKPMQHLLTRYLSEKLEEVGCTLETYAV